MQGLRAIALIAATLLLIGGGVGAGYYARGNTSANETSAALKPAPVPNFPGTLKMSMDDGSVCTVDFEGKTSTCTFPDGARQTMSVSEGDLHINTIALGEDDCSVVPMVQPIENATLGHVDLATVAANTTERLIRPGTQSKRVNSWVIAVPESLRAAAGVDEVTEFEYFEKDGKAWKAEFFAEGKEDPTVVRFDASNDAVPATKCTSATAHARALQRGSKRVFSASLNPEDAAEVATTLYCKVSGLAGIFGGATCLALVLGIALTGGLCGDKKGPKGYRNQGGRNWGENCWEACGGKSGMCQFCSTHTKEVRSGLAAKKDSAGKRWTEYGHGGACCRLWGSYGVPECRGQGPAGYHGCSRDATNNFGIHDSKLWRRRLGNLRQVADISAGMVDFDMLSTAATAAATAGAAAASSQLIEAIAN